MAEKKLKQVVEELRGMSDQELADALANERRKLYELNSRNVTRQLDNTAAIPYTRKMIARILTLQGEREKAAG